MILQQIKLQLVLKVSFHGDILIQISNETISRKNGEFHEG